MKRFTDLIISFLGLVLLSPVILPILIIVWLQDFHNPFYVASRVGKNEKIFKMIKLRSMKINADKSGVDSTSSNDSRITTVGMFIRKFKLDEISQLINVFIGDMSLVGPRPNVKRETDLYTLEEKHLLSVKPGITDFSSIVFSDEGDILKDSVDPDLDYNQLIRPWKSRLGIFYIKNRSLALDFILIFLTVLAILNRDLALNKINKILKRLNANDVLLKIAKRNVDLIPAPPPGSNKVVESR
tara:strand:- start:663 stop:1388 length:726 start_codon:yes stop_codon:yes gene_type:complete